MRFPNYMEGMVLLELVSAHMERTMIRLNGAGIELYGLHRTDDLTQLFWVRRRDCSRALHLCSQMDGTVRILKKSGLYWPVHRFLKRPVLLLWVITTVLFCMLLQSRILFIRVEGNDLVPDRQILAAAEECGIRFGSSRREIRSEKIKNELLTAIPQLQWAGVNTAGCVATVSVRERSQSAQEEVPSGVCSIVAGRDGFILSASATRGSLLVQPGQTVKSGQLLISGYTDCGIVIRAEQAEGEILAQTERTIRAISPGYTGYKRNTGEYQKKISLLLGKKRIFLWKDSGISSATCGRMYEEYYITLPGGFRLPAALCIERFVRYEDVQDHKPESESDHAMEAYVHSYVTGQMSAGEILHTDVRITDEDNSRILNGRYICREMIGRVRHEQIGDINGQDSGTNRERRTG